MQKIESVETLLTQAKQKVADKKSRGGPGGKSKLTTGQRKKIGKKQGGSLRTVNKKKNPGLAKLPTPVRNKMGYAKKGGKIDPYAEGTGTPKGTKGTPPPSIFDQKKKKKNYGGKVMYKKHGGKVGEIVTGKPVPSA